MTRSASEYRPVVENKIGVLSGCRGAKACMIETLASRSNDDALFS
jgi:hypothetical protein